MSWRWTAVGDWLKDPKTGAEVGVKEGRFISYMLGKFPGLTMYAIDPWENQQGKNEDYIGWDWDSIYNQYKRSTAPYNGRVVELREYSVSASANIQDGSLDFVFIDAQHDYESVKQDIEVWTPKVKAGGLLSGHDYDNNFPGVVKAVNEAFDNPRLATNAVWGVWL